MFEVLGAIDRGVTIATYRAVELAARIGIFNKWKLLGLGAITYGVLNPSSAGEVVSNIFNGVGGLMGARSPYPEYDSFYG